MSLLHRTMLMAIFLLGLDSSIAAAHEPIEEDICVRRIVGSMVRLNAYQPQYETKIPYCTDIPAKGDTFLVVDLIDPGLRKIPVGVRLVKGIDETAEDQTVAYWPPVTHPDGVVRGQATLEKGLYRLVVLVEGFSPSSYPLRVNMTDYAALARNSAGLMVGFLVLAIIAYELSKSKRLQRWWSSARS